MPPYQSTPLDEFFITVPGLPSHTAVLEHAEEAADSKEEPRIPLSLFEALALVGGALCTAVGSFSIVIGVFG